ncbi:hypothetical protein HID58_042450, partial [Brassica napus]
MTHRRSPRQPLNKLLHQNEDLSPAQLLLLHLFHCRRLNQKFFNENEFTSNKPLLCAILFFRKASYSLRTTQLHGSLSRETYKPLFSVEIAHTSAPSWWDPMISDSDSVPPKRIGSSMVMVHLAQSYRVHLAQSYRVHLVQSHDVVLIFVSLFFQLSQAIRSNLGKGDLSLPLLAMILESLSSSCRPTAFDKVLSRTRDDLILQWSYQNIIFRVSSEAFYGFLRPFNTSIALIVVVFVYCLAA